MDAQKPQQPLRTGSGRMVHIPSFNDFCSFTSQDSMEQPLERSWSLGSDASMQPKKASPVRGMLERAFYEHMRSN
jgi:hypothetical protein